jgi:NADPH2:quinone reductase
MKAVTVRRFGGPDVLEVEELPDPEVGKGEVCIRVAASSVNLSDTLLRTGRLRLPAGMVPPYVPGMEFAGHVVGVGEDADAPDVGTAVMGITSMAVPGGGAQASLRCVPATWVVPVPDSMSLAEASTVAMNGLTAWRALQLLALPSGASLGVTGAVGAVGGYVLTLARAAGLRVVADAAEADVDQVRALGATDVVPRGVDVARSMRSLVPGGVDGIVDASVQGTATLIAAVRDGGGFAGVRRTGPLTSERDIAIHRVAVTDLLGRPDLLSRMAEQIASGPVRPRIAASYPPEGVADAHRRIEAGGVRGRLLIDFS